MSLKVQKCPNCGGPVNINMVSKEGACAYCGTPVVYEAPLPDQFIENNNYTIGHVDTMVYQDESSIQSKIDNVEIYISTLHDYAKARELLSQLENIAPGRYEVWWSYIRALTNNLTNEKCSRSEFSRLEDYAKRMFRVAPSEEVKTLRLTWNEYADRHAKWFSDVELDLESLKSEVQNLEKQISENEREQKEIDRRFELNPNWRQRGSYLKKRRPINVLLTLAIIWFIICMIVFGATRYSYTSGVGIIFLIIGIALLVLVSYGKYHSGKTESQLKNKKTTLQVEMNDYYKKRKTLNEEITALEIQWMN